LSQGSERGIVVLAFICETQRAGETMSCPTGSGFEASSAVDAFHGIPHTDIDLQESPDQFQPDNQQYWEVMRQQ
jgi:hypothetical protein